MSIDKIVYKSWISYNPAAKEKCSLVMKRFIKRQYCFQMQKLDIPFTIAEHVIVCVQ